MKTFRQYLSEAASVKPGDKIRIFNGPLSWKAEVLEVRPDGSIRAVKDLYDGRIHSGGQWEGAYEKLSEAYKLTQDQWDSEVKFGLSRGHSKPKFKLGQKVNKGEIVAMTYVRFSIAPLYTVKDKNNQEHDYYEEELR